MQVAAAYHCIPALMLKRGLRVRAPKQVEFVLGKLDEIVCTKCPARFRCSTSSDVSSPTGIGVLTTRSTSCEFLYQVLST